MKKKTDENIMNILVQANPSFIYHSYIKCGINEEEKHSLIFKVIYLYFYFIKLNVISQG